MVIAALECLNLKCISDHKKHMRQRCGPRATLDRKIRNGRSRDNIEDLSDRHLLEQGCRHLKICSIEHIVFLCLIVVLSNKRSHCSVKYWIYVDIKLKLVKARMKDWNRSWIPGAWGLLWHSPWSLSQAVTGSRCRVRTVSAELEMLCEFCGMKMNEHFFKLIRLSEVNLLIY